MDRIGMVVLLTVLIVSAPLWAAPAAPAQPIPLPASGCERDLASDSEKQELDRLAGEIQGTIVYTQTGGRKGYQVKVMNVGEWKPKTLCDGRFARWSADGSKIAYWNQDNRGGQLLGSVWVMNADGSGQKKLVSDVESLDFEGGCPIEFHPNGKEIVYVPAPVRPPANPKFAGVYQGLWAVDVGTGQTRKLDLPSDNFTSEMQFSVDGRYMACRHHELDGRKSLTIVDTVAKTQVAHGFGCMASLSPDGQWISNNYGGHNRMTLWNRDGKRRLDYSAIGITADNTWDALHWSNDMNYFCIRGDGKLRPVYVARFDEAEAPRFTRVVFSDGRCEYPDLFVRKVLQAPVAKAPAAAPAGTNSWPAQPYGAVFAWANDSSSNLLKTAAGAKSCEVAMHGLAKYGGFFDMDLTYGGGYFSAEKAESDVLEACAKSNQFTIEALVTPAGGNGTIVSFGANPRSRNFALLERKDKLVVALRTSKTGEGGEEFELTSLSPDAPNHVVVSYRPGRLACYVNGRLMASNVLQSGDLSNWSAQKLTFGAEAGARNSWKGLIEGVVIYSRALSASEAGADCRAYAARLAKRSRALLAVVEAKLVNKAQLPDPRTLKDYPRALIECLYDVQQVKWGQLDDKRIRVARWAILDGAIIPDAQQRKAGDVVTIRLEKFDDNPQVQSERRVELDDDDAMLLPLYLDVSPLP